MPFQCRLTFSEVVLLVARNPTTHTSVAESAEIAPALMVTPVKAGLAAMLQVLPSQCATSASGEPTANPTAQALSPAGAVTRSAGCPGAASGWGPRSS